MTLDEMAPLRVHPEPQVRKLAEHYGALWDAASDLCFSINADDLTSELRGTSAEDPFADLCKVLDRQPNI